MPFDHNAPLAPETGTLALSSYDKPDPAFLDTLSAAFRQENIIGSYFTSARRGVDDFDRVEPGYNPFDDIGGYEEFADRFEGAFNPQAGAAIKADIDRETKDRQTLAASGWTGVGLQMGATILDPTILIPGGALVKAGRLGYSTSRSALALGGAAAAGAAVQEAGLQATQEIRPASETALAIGGSAILGGLVGAAGARLFTNAEWSTFSKALRDDLASEVPNPDELVETLVSRAQSAGAASIDRASIEDLGVGGPRIAQAVAKATAAARLNPGIETLFSPSRTVREVYGRMVDNPVYTSMNMRGETLGPDVENTVKQWQRGALAQWVRASSKLYREAKKAGFAGSRADFNEAVAFAGRRGDIDPNGNPYVTKAAQEAREKVFNPLLREAQEAGQIPKDIQVRTAATYVTRVWNRQRLIAQEDRFREIAREYFRNAIARLPAEEIGIDFVSKADLDDYVEEVVSSVFNNLTGRGKGDVPAWIVPVTRGPMKERTFRIADAKVEDFLENDAELILRRYTRVMGGEVELARKFGRADMAEQFDAIRAEYDALRKAATTEAERLDLIKAEARDVQNLSAFRDMIRGTYRAAEESSEWGVITRSALAFNFVRLLGGVALTSITDIGRLFAVHGLRATMAEGIPALARQVKAAKISRQDARDLGVVAEWVLQSRLATLAELNDPFAYRSRYERFLSNATSIFAKATGLALLNDTTRTIASVMTQNRILRNALAGSYDKLAKAERAYMGFIGIDETTAQRIAEQFRRYGVEDKGIRGANLSQWDDEVARRAYGAALAKDTDRTILIPGVADRPLWTRTNWGRILIQFKSFGLASHQRVLIAGLQERPHRFMEGLAFGTGIGMLVGVMKYLERGDDDQAQRLMANPGLWIADGFDRTGILFMLTEPLNTLDRVSASYGGPGIGPARIAGALAGDENTAGGMSRFASRNATGALMGPTVGIIEDLAQIAAATMNANQTKGSVNAAIRMIPGATLPGVRTAIHVGIKPRLHDEVQ